MKTSRSEGVKNAGSIFPGGGGLPRGGKGAPSPQPWECMIYVPGIFELNRQISHRRKAKMAHHFISFAHDLTWMGGDLRFFGQKRLHLHMIAFAHLHLHLHMSSRGRT